MNLYIFNVRYGETTIARSVTATTYNAALNLLYFPPNGETQADETTLIALRHQGVYVGHYGLNNATLFDMKV